MKTNKIRKAIQRAVQEEERTGWLRARIRKSKVARDPTDDGCVDAVLTLMRHYVESVPDLLDEIERAADASGWKDVIAPLLDTAEAYFFETNDLVPDRHGLGGLLDDAYLAVDLVMKISSHVEEEEDVPLLENDLGGLIAMHAAARALLGKGVHRQLDQAVAAAMQQIWVQDVLRGLHDLPSGSLPLHNTPHPIWGNASTKEIVDAQIGSLGIYPTWNP